MADWKALGTEYLVRLMDERVLSRPDAGGRRSVPEAMTASLRANGLLYRGFALAAAYVASPESGKHALSNHPALWRVAIDVGESLRRRVEQWTRPDGHPPHFAHRFLPQTYRLIEGRLSKAAQRRWQRTMARFVANCIDFLKRKEATWGRPGPFLGTGPNHLFAIAGQIAAAGRILGDADAARFARRAMLALCRQQTPEGYFPENSGPSVGYMAVYLGGLSDYVAATGDEQVLPVLRRAARFSTRALYPNLMSLATIDQRNRCDHPPRAGGAGSLAWVPAGRSVVLATLTEATAALPVADPVQLSRFLGCLAIELLQAPGGPTAPIPVRRAVHHDAFDGLATVGRKSGWFHVLSGYHEQPEQYNPFLFERTENLSVYHDACGLIVGGGNDKFAPQAATIELVEARDVHYFPALAASASGTAATGRLSLDYGAAAAELRVRVRSASLLELTASASTNFRHNSNRLNLQIPSLGGRTLLIDGKPFSLSARTATLRIAPVRRQVTSPGQWTIEVPGGAELHFPHVPYQKMDYPGPLESAVAFLRIALGGRGERRTVRFHVPPVAATGRR